MRICEIKKKNSAFFSFRFSKSSLVNNEMKKDKVVEKLKKENETSQACIER